MTRSHEPERPLDLGARDDDPVPGLDDAHLEELLQRTLASDAPGDADLLPPGAARTRKAG